MLRARPAGTEYSVVAISEYIRSKIAGDELLRNVRVRGEVTNYTAAGNGNIYFDLIEGKTFLRCVAWADANFNFPAFKTGAIVVASGAIATYPQRSVYQLVVSSVELAGVGDVHALYEQRKKKLKAEGLFEDSRKRALPAYPFRIALVSSKNAAGAKDFAKLMRESRPHVRIVWCDANVQGAQAPSQIVGALGRASRLDVDAIVLTRGGGSFEDLFVFSDESVVRAVAAAVHPVISAVGHSTDLQLCDLAADVHADTPSRAVELIGPPASRARERIATALERARRSASLDIARHRQRFTAALVRSRLDDPQRFFLEERQQVDALGEDLIAAARRGVALRQERFDALAVRLLQCDPSLRLAERGLKLERLTHQLATAGNARASAAAQRLERSVPRLAPAMRTLLERAAQRAALLRTKLDGNDPDALLQKGYAIVTLDGHIVTDPAAVPLGATIAARVRRGTLSARVEAKESNAD